MYYHKNILGRGLRLTIVILLFICINSMLFASNKSGNIAGEVENALSYHLNKYFNVTSSRNGIITIKGTVHNLYDKYRIFDIAKEVKGVKRIKDLVAINTLILPNDIIKANLLEDLRLDNSILEPNRIKVAVDNGLIELSGTVSYPGEKLSAETDASWQKGALGIVNRIKVLSPKAAESDHNLKILLGSILKDKFPLEKDVQLTIHNGIVKVEGNSNSDWAEQHLTKDFSRIKGVKEIINDITIRNGSLTPA